MADKYACHKCETEIVDPTCTVVQAMPMKINDSYKASTITIQAKDKDTYFQPMYFHNDCWVTYQKTYDAVKTSVNSIGG